jgi:hypothetical protein
MIWARAGDTFFTRSTSLLGRLIRWGETESGEMRTWTNHTGVVIEPGWLMPPNDYKRQYLPAIVVEALWKVREGPLKLNDTEVRAFRPIPPYYDLELARFIVEAKSFVGNRYGWWKLFGFLIKRATHGKVDPTKFYFIKNRPICSYLAAWCNKEARPSLLNFGMLPQMADPDEMLDYCEAHPDLWEEL